MTNDVKLHRLDPWYRGPMTALDFETTCVEPEEARIVGAAVVTVQAGKAHNGAHSWIVNPGVPIEPGATEVHGITDVMVQEVGLDPAAVVPTIVAKIREAWARYWPVVIYNAPFDLTVLDREFRRYHGTGLGEIGPVIDPFVLDKLVDPYRRGSRKLIDVAAHYGADILTGVHGAERDAMATVRTAWKLGHHHPRIGGMPLDKLFRLQIEAKRRQSAGLRDYFVRTGNPEASRVDDSWPIRLWVERTAIEAGTAGTCPACGRSCPMEHDADGCGWCGECHPEVPEWTT